jgi:hypothetical protein
MANEEFVHLLKQGPQIWNAWRMQHPDNQPLDLTGCDLAGLELPGANLSGADLSSAKLNLINLGHATLTDATLVYADLSQANLSQANLSRAIIMYANLDAAHLSQANLSQASLVETSFIQANLHGANLSQASLAGSDLTETLFIETDIDSVDFTNSTMYHTVLAGIDLRSAGGLQSVFHHGPSHVSLSTIVRSHGSLPKQFLRGTGTPESFIQPLASLALQSNTPASCSISYSPWDKMFAEQLHADLQDLGIRCWLFPKYTGRQGEWIRTRWDERAEATMNTNDKVVLVLSEHSINSPWIEIMVNNLLKREREVKRSLLILCQLDSTLMKTKSSWIADLLKIHQILDFTQWKKKEAYDSILFQLLTVLQEGH